MSCFNQKTSNSLVFFLVFLFIWTTKTVIKKRKNTLDGCGISIFNIRPRNSFLNNYLIRTHSQILKKKGTRREKPSTKQTNNMGENYTVFHQWITFLFILTIAIADEMNEAEETSNTPSTFSTTTQPPSSSMRWKERVFFFFFFCFLFFFFFLPLSISSNGFSSPFNRSNIIRQQWQNSETKVCNSNQTWRF